MVWGLMSFCIHKPDIWRAKTHARVSGYPNNLYFGFEDFEGAIKKIEASGARSFFVDKDIDLRDSRPTRGCQRTYGVANGDQRGLYGTYGWASLRSYVAPCWPSSIVVWKEPRYRSTISRTHATSHSDISRTRQNSAKSVKTQAQVSIW